MEESSVEVYCECGYPGCDGVLIIVRDEGCYCHIHPPCEYCEEQELKCPKCGWEAWH